MNIYVYWCAVNRYVYLHEERGIQAVAGKAGATFEPAKGGHLKVTLNGRQSILPMHGSRHELKRGTVEAIKKQLGLK